MPKVAFPYGKETLTLDIPENRFKAELVSKMHHYKTEASQQELVQKALENPIGTPTLRVMAEGKKRVLIIASDHTRPVPSKVIIPPMLAEIRAGNPDAQISILVSTGCHRETTKEELVNKFGADIVNRERILIHDCDSPDVLNLGKLPSGGDFIINKVAMEADLLVAEGFIEPHFFAGYSGGRKSVLPGIVSRETVLYNHNAEFIDSPYARAGIVEGNPIHIDMLYAARTARLAFICNVVINAEKEVIYAVAGDVDLAHRTGREFLAGMCQVEGVSADIAITTNGGYPLDQNIYQAVKGMTAAEATVKKDGVIVMLAKSNDGHGGEEFYKTFVEEKNLARMTETFLKTPKNKTRVDQWESQILARVLQHARVIYVSDAPDEMVKAFQMIPAHSLEEAVKKAEELLKNPQATITAIPDGIAVMVKKAQDSF
ncbi:MAG: nickel-dependent lactate racemase [Spirochaetaceae bacterium]|jgi:nickel-dependent lactate racemase|nr:nickel-dependent lactate racemase [Spirochaetaceae bacterium]